MDVREYVNLLHDLKVLERKIAHIFEKRLGISLTRHLKKLEEAGYIKKCRNKENNREIFVEITAASKNKIDSCVKDTDVRNIISEYFTDDDLKNLTKLLDKFNKSLI